MTIIKLRILLIFSTNFLVAGSTPRVVTATDSSVIRSHLVFNPDLYRVVGCRLVDNRIAALNRSQSQMDWGRKLAAGFRCNLAASWA